MNIRIGTAGYSYSDWVGEFYPTGTRSNQMLSFYAQHFPLVELNFTFYRPPTVTMLSRLAEQTPAGFQFIVKLPRTVSHDQRRDDLPAFRQAVGELQRRGRLFGLLAQLPQSTHDDRRNRAWINTLSQELAGLGLAVEFRHRSWANPGVAPWLGERGVDLVSVDVPNLRGLFPTGLVRSTSHIYVRFHSRNAGNWYAGEKGRYDYDYSSEELREWATALAEAEDADRALLLFNNCYRGQAIFNARRMRELLDREAPHHHVIEPFAATTPVQRSLFD